MDGETNDETEKSLQPASLQETSAFFDCRRFLYYPGSGFWNFGGVGIWYVDPERKIPAESSAVSGITDADVAGAPKDYQVLQDFFKFTRNAIIIGYNNINFDNVFLIGQGKKCRWDFASNETDDVFRYAQKLVHGVKNYKLGTIAEKLGVVLDNAHRAVYDALATAEVFIKLAEMM